MWEQFARLLVFFKIFPQDCGEWLKGYVLEETGNKREGIFPKNFVHFKKQTLSPRGLASSSPVIKKPLPTPPSSRKNSVALPGNSRSPHAVVPVPEGFFLLFFFSSSFSS